MLASVASLLRNAKNDDPISTRKPENGGIKTTIWVAIFRTFGKSLVTIWVHAAKAVHAGATRNKNGGTITWQASIIFSAFVGVTLIWAATRPFEIIFYEAPAQRIQIVGRGGDAYKWLMKFEGRPVKDAWWGKFCNGYRPKFDIGHTLRWLRAESSGNCWFIDSPELGYKLVNDEFGDAVLAPNCYNNYTVNRVDCDGVPDFTNMVYKESRFYGPQAQRR